MTLVKEAVLESIYEAFATWAAGYAHVCRPGCAVCCTKSVMVTAVEGELIHRHVRARGEEEWLVACLLNKGATRRPLMTTNEFAGFCLEGKETPPEEDGNRLPCPFLEQNHCRIYEVRPFACRCFASQETCQPRVPALLAPEYLSAAIAVQQIVEHLGQGEYWGNLLDVLTALCDLPENKKCMDFLSQSFVEQARVQIVKARPLPGFLLMEEEMPRVWPLLEKIFTSQVENKTVEAILNGR